MKKKKKVGKKTHTELATVRPGASRNNVEFPALPPPPPSWDIKQFLPTEGNPAAIPAPSTSIAAEFLQRPTIPKIAKVRA